MTASELIEKGERAAASAQLLLEAGDIDGACNRAYYAMFDAARAALLATEAPVPAEIARTHSGLISAFSLHLVKTGRVTTALGRLQQSRRSQVDCGLFERSNRPRDG